MLNLGDCIGFVYAMTCVVVQLTEYGMDLFIVWLGIVIILVFLTILQQIVQAAQQNPAEVIKSE